MSETEFSTTTITTARSLYNRFKAVVSSKGLTIKEVINEFITNYVKENE